MSISITTRAGKGSPLNATEHDDNLLNIVAGIENTSTGHDHDGTDSKKVIAGNVTNTPAGNIAATDVQSALNELDTEKLAKASNLSDVANAATAFGNIKQSASTTVTGVSELATTDETITGTDTARTTTPAGVAGAMAVQTNPLAKSQGVHMTYAASGSSGIAVADNDNIDFGTGDFTLVWKGSLPDWTPAYNVYLISKYQDVSNQVYVTVDNGGTLSFYSAKAGTVARADSSIVNTLTNNSEHEIVFVVIRESLGANGNCSVYIDGKLFETLTISAASPIDISNTGALNIAGRNAARYDSVNKSAYTYNRALTASEVLDLYRNGIAFADKWGSQTALTSGTLTVGKKYRINTYVSDDDFTNIGASSNASGVEFVATGTTPTHWAHSSSLVLLGATLALEPEGIQTDKWYDSSSNALNATYPASGSSLTRTKNGNIDRVLGLNIEPGATPNTNINITYLVALSWNAPSTSDATNLAASGTSGSFSLSADGKTITYAITPNILAINSITIVRSKLNTASATTYYVYPGLSNGDLLLQIEPHGTPGIVDWRTILDSGDVLRIFISMKTDS